MRLEKNILYRSKYLPFGWKVEGLTVWESIGLTWNLLVWGAVLFMRCNWVARGNWVAGGGNWMIGGGNWMIVGGAWVVGGGNLVAGGGSWVVIEGPDLFCRNKNFGIRWIF